jgi:hypothetical protein
MNRAVKELKMVTPNQKLNSPISKVLNISRPGVVAHAYNLRYSEGRNQENHSPARLDIKQDYLSKITKAQKGWGMA